MCTHILYTQSSTQKVPEQWKELSCSIRNSWASAARQDDLEESSSTVQCDLIGDQAQVDFCHNLQASFALQIRDMQMREGNIGSVQLLCSLHYQYLLFYVFSLFFNPVFTLASLVFILLFEY